MPHLFFKKKLLGIASFPQASTHSEEEKKGAFGITILDYDANYFEEAQVTSFEECIPYLSSPHLTWVNIDGHPNKEFLQKLTEYYHLHPLLIEDIHTEQRPKVEPFEKVLYVVLRSLYYESEKVMIENEQISIILGDGFVISFQEKEHDLTRLIKERIQHPNSRQKHPHTDYLMYTILDIVVDNYFVVLEKIAETVDLLEEDLISTSDAKILRHIHLLKRETILIRKNVWPLREVLSKINRGDYSLISPGISLYLRDLYDHTIQVIDTIETFRDMISGILDLYLSNIGYKTNEIMKTLTIAATIFAPLTFLTGLWGMNFAKMPELQWKWGYPCALGLMLSVIILMLFFFKKKKWI